MNGGNNQGAVKMMLLNDDERFSTYGPAEPTVKILKRPTLEQHNRSITEAKPKAPMKSLRQREHEYAVSIRCISYCYFLKIVTYGVGIRFQQARLRILGAAKSPEEMTE